MNKIHEFHPGQPDFTPFVREALGDKSCAGLRFAPGRYNFYPDRAAEKYLFISNNDEGLKRVVFLLEDRRDFAVEADGAEFVFHGGLVPFHLDRCDGVRLSGFRMDWAVPFHGEGIVRGSDAAGVEIEIPEAFPFAVRNGRLLFGPSPENFVIRNILEFDAVRRETAFQVLDNFHIGRRCHAEETGPRRVRLHAEFREPRPQPGNVLALVSERRDFPAIAAQSTRRLLIRGVTIHHAGAMGLIAQRCEDIRVERLRVSPPDDGSRMVSTTADATHFVNCRGPVVLEDCVFENQMDDATNVHGLYTQITRVLGPSEFEVRLAHRQQRGVDFAQPGELLELVDRDTLATKHTARVAGVQRLNSEFLRITLEEAPPTPPHAGDAVGNLTWSADVTIRHCRCSGNRARGFLLSVPGCVVVEENTFHTAGAAILIEGDTNFWFESGAVRDILIRRNTFEDCKYGIWAKAQIQISPGIKEEHQPGSSYHRNVRIEDNLFRAFDTRIVRARGVDGLVIRDNRILLSTNYPAQHVGAPPFDTEGCPAVVLENNTIESTAHVPSQPA